VITIPDRGAVPVLSPRKLQRIILRKKMNLKLPSVKVVKCDVSGSEVSKDYQKSPSAEREEIDVIGRWRRSRTRTVRFGVSTTLPPAQSAACVDPFRALFGSASFVNNLPFTPFYYLHNHNRYECCYDCRPRRPTPVPPPPSPRLWGSPAVGSGSLVSSGARVRAALSRELDGLRVELTLRFRFRIRGASECQRLGVARPFHTSIHTPSLPS
jgi:hypothetical protein